MPDFLYQLLLDWGALFRPYVRDIALAMVATCLVVFGDAYITLIKELTGLDSPAGKLPKVTNATLRQAVLQGGMPPLGMDVTQIMVDRETVQQPDPLGLGQALAQANAGDEKRAAEIRPPVGEADGHEDQVHTLRLYRHSVDNHGRGGGQEDAETGRQGTSYEMPRHRTDIYLFPLGRALDGEQVGDRRLFADLNLPNKRQKDRPRIPHGE